MEEHKLIPREELKTYFEGGKYPTQSQFSDLVNSLKHKKDELTNKEAVIIANRLQLMDNGYIEYTGNNIGDKEFLIAIGSGDEEDQEIAVRESVSGEKRYLLGSAPYSVKVKEFPADGLGETEYYSLRCQADGFAINKLFGNNLPMILKGTELGTFKGKSLFLGIGKQKLEQKINIINTNIKLVNKTQASILYGTSATYWGLTNISGDIITDHYDAWDVLSFWYSADLRESDRSIECKMYDADHEKLLMTAYLNAKQNNQDVWGGNQVRGVRNLRIECSYAAK
ncbi:hypothetical protein F3J23_14400 [Chryseobacterium sp. Tr-659]|uniref:hypothetical protein n=1 Tax=Chryseobacterium sp. Tr-659 TaxID=2608340 RepID=UPI00142022FD|nr:hypothetical protein [Chryseobacterium sp. Tr-659]NIF06637.1 hypothetical protein [Chryseobacterium sp. Tr-659]